jgi:type I restriction enzyme S subunit
MSDGSYPQRWEVAELAEVAKIVSGSTPKTSIAGNWKGEIPWLTPNDLSKYRHKLIGAGERFITKAGYDSCSTQLVPAGSVLFTSRAPIGYVAIASNELCTNQGFKSAVPSERISSDFLYWQLQYLVPEIRSRASGTTFLEISGKRFGQTQVVVPPLAEQEKIVETLEEQLSRLDAAAGAITAVRAKADRFRLSLLNSASRIGVSGATDEGGVSATNWPLVRLADCLEKLSSGKYAERGWSPQCLKVAVDDEVSWGVLKTTAVQMGEYLPEHNKRLPSSLEPKVGLAVEPGDFLMTTTGPRNRCGVVCHVKTTPRNLIFSGKILRFRPKEDVLSSGWLLTVLMSPTMQKTLNELKVGTSDSSVSIGNSQVLDLTIPLPPIDDQNELLESVERGITSVSIVNQTLDELEVKLAGLRRSLLHSAFSGNLTREWREAQNG